MNMAGLSKASVPSAVLECKEWTITLPGTQEHVSYLRKEGSHDTETAKMEPHACVSMIGVVIGSQHCEWSSLGSKR